MESAAAPREASPVQTRRWPCSPLHSSSELRLDLVSHESFGFFGCHLHLPISLQVLADKTAAPLPYANSAG